MMVNIELHCQRFTFENVIWFLEFKFWIVENCYLLIWHFNHKSNFDDIFFNNELKHLVCIYKILINSSISFLEFNSVLNRLMIMTNMNVDGMRVHNETWAQQFMDAMNVNGGDIENATSADYVMHFLTFGFKVNWFILMLTR